MARRATFVDIPVTYGAVGATQRSDLLQYPPRGFRPIERSIRLGSGAERFAASREAMLAWEVQRGAGLEVRDVTAGTGEQYPGLRYDESGSPVAPEAPPEIVYGPDGQPNVANGVSAVLRLGVGPFHVDSPVRVVYVIDEPRRFGFAYGTLAGHPASGEEAFFLDWLADDSVWFTIRAFSRASGPLYRLLTPITRSVFRTLTTRFLRALHPAVG
ncbi:DUF1990 domain-containing protein [Gryllotalpicola sp.]|uniref:DUF1990 family protein n=1 Tax=Gryllotalpicola sp. TaxID=1932787 RepID=UPI0026333D3E|nr:DUF1990 domain-containing protein [Gryllotalpicola sp.]